MDVTRFIVSRRERGLLSGDYSTYKRRLAQRLLIVRKRLHHTSTQGKSNKDWSTIKAEDVASNHDHLVELISSPQVKAGPQPKVEARAYFVLHSGAFAFEKQQWRACLQYYSEARLIYGSLVPTQISSSGALFQELLSSFIDPSLRFAAYRTKEPRTTSLEAVVRDNIPRKSLEHLEGIQKLHPDVFSDRILVTGKSSVQGSSKAPETVRWRSKIVNLEDAATGQALAAVTSAEGSLSLFLCSKPQPSAKEKAAAYDEILISSQDAVDATKIAIDELSGDGLSQSDPRVQAMQITRTAVSYALVGWRVGRNRVLCGEHDGAALDTSQSKHAKILQPSHKGSSQENSAESKSHKLRRLKEKIVLYDATLQSLDSVQLLPGIAADQAFQTELHGKHSYFQSLRCLALARCHQLEDHQANALALLSRAQRYCSAASVSQGLSMDPKGPPNLAIVEAQLDYLKTLLQGLLIQYRSLVEIKRHPYPAKSSDRTHPSRFSEHLDEFPLYLVDLQELVSYPPEVSPMPVKPIFLDVAFNYIEYPGRGRYQAEPRHMVNGKLDPSQKEAKKGWFGFGR
ncbi:uncharacterized protein KY384_008671 [Bacidia gigantensis]|uniref:uncharacterized protein n=1 Tax=Bacidia gigantensis TaxID=2732470 RepID=UPI001D04100C|nr:uncharacterized protein KY384_008671 [Bacidia gigantensis]KAG8526471.1 hypothetical protein KY384_008671 [Bacidia gigantensis]